MDQHAINDLLRLQDGVISRRQVLAYGGTDNDIERLIRRRVWARLHEGLYVDHTGLASWHQRAWAATLYHEPAALAGRSALKAHGLRAQPGRDRDPSDQVIEVAVDQDRRPRPTAGVRAERMTDFADVALLHLHPPRVRLERAVLQAASEAPDEAAAVAVVADACQARRTTPALLADTLRGQARLRHRRLLLTILEDVACGAYSVLERRYLRDVERPHGLPTGRRQRRVKLGRSPAYRDVDYVGLGTLVELDGRLGHERATDRWADVDRDIESAVNGELTVRAGWKQVLDPCRLAAAIARILIARGWTGVPHGCAPDCPVAGIKGPSPAPGAGERP